MSSRSCCFSCLPCRRIVYTRSVFCPREALLLVVKVVLVVFPTQQAVSRNFVREALLLVVKVVLVVFPTQQAASKQHDTTFASLHLRIKNYTAMNKNNKNINSNQNHGDHCQHVQIGGQAYYDDRKYFLFSPDAPVPQAVESFRKAGVGQQMSDGTFDFVVRPKVKSRSVLIRKLAHGRISRTQDDAVQLTLKFFRTENVVIAQAIMDEAQDAIDALLNEQLTK